MLLITHVSSVDHYIDENEMPENKKSNTLMAFLLGEMTGFGFGVFFATVNENIPFYWI